jgi:hypothetical protein
VLCSPHRTDGPVYRDRRRWLAHSAAIAGTLEHMTLEKITGRAAMSGMRALGESSVAVANVAIGNLNDATAVPALRLPSADKDSIMRGAQRFRVTTIPGTVDMSTYWSGGGWHVHNPSNGNTGTYLARSADIIRQGAEVSTADSMAIFAQAIALDAAVAAIDIGLALSIMGLAMTFTGNPVVGPVVAVVGLVTVGVGVLLGSQIPSIRPPVSSNPQAPLAPVDLTNQTFFEIDLSNSPPLSPPLDPTPPPPDDANVDADGSTDGGASAGGGESGADGGDGGDGGDA